MKITETEEGVIIAELPHGGTLVISLELPADLENRVKTASSRSEVIAIAGEFFKLLDEDVPADFSASKDDLLDRIKGRRDERKWALAEVARLRIMIAEEEVYIARQMVEEANVQLQQTLAMAERKRCWRRRIIIGCVLIGTMLIVVLAVHFLRLG